MMSRLLSDRRSPGVTALAVAALIVTLLAALCAGGCSSDTDAASSDMADGRPLTLTVSAASSLKAAFADIGAAFDAANGSKTTFNFDGSGTLQQQIEAGAPVDVFASAAMKQVEALSGKGLLDDASTRIFAGNEIVLVLPADSTLALADFTDLIKPEVGKIAYGDPAVAPHGTAAEEVLTTLGIYDEVRPKVIYTPNVTQTLEYVASGEVDAAILFASEAALGGERVRVAATSEPDWHDPIAYPIALVASSPSKSLASVFIDFVAGPEGQAILAQYGFQSPPDQTKPGQ